MSKSAILIRLTLMMLGLLVSSTSTVFGQTWFELTLSGGVATFFGNDPSGTIFVCSRDCPPLGTQPEVETGYTLGLAGRVRTRRLGFEASATWIPTEVSLPNRSGGADLGVYGFTGSGLLYFPLNRAGLEAFVTAGGGVRVYDRNVTRAYPSWSLGGGASVPITGSVDLRFEARNFMAVTDIADFQPNANPNPSDERFQSDLALTIGLTFYKPREGK